MVPGGWVALVLAGIALVSPAAADVRVLAVQGPDAPLPFVQSGSVAVAIEADCTSLLARAAFPGSEEPIPAFVAWDPTGGLGVFGVDRIDVPVRPCLDGAKVSSASASFQVVAERSTVAFVRFPVGLNVSLAPIQDRLAALPLESASAHGSFDASVQPVLASTVVVPDKDQPCACSDAQFHLVLAARGNARVAYHFSLEGSPQDPGWRVDLPDDLVASPPALGGQPQTVTLRVHAPTTRWSVATFRVAVDVASPDDAAFTWTPLSAEMMLTNAGAHPQFQDSIVGPGFVAAAFIVAIAGCVLIARRIG
jgi:hypothetical protein